MKQMKQTEQTEQTEQMKDLTETELTQLAMEAMRKKSKPETTEVETETETKPETTETTEVETVEKKSKPETTEVKTETETETKVQGSDFSDHRLVLGTNKVIYFKPWTGRTKKLFKQAYKKLLEQIQNEEINEISTSTGQELTEILVRNHIDQPTIYLSDSEMQFILVNIRKESLRDSFEYKQNCPSCDKMCTISTSISESCIFTPSLYPSDYKNLKFVDIDEQDTLELEQRRIPNISEYFSIVTPEDIEVILHIDNGTSTEDKIRYTDNLSLSDLTDLMTALSKVSSQFKISAHHKCEKCNESSEFITNQIPGLFDELLG